MRTEISIVAARGRTVRYREQGGLAVRQTGATGIHLIGTAATPLGGDEIIIRVVVAEGARLDLRTVAATIALPSAHCLESSTRWEIEVASGGALFCEPEPMIVAADAVHHSQTSVSLAADARVVVAEHAQLGRHAEVGRGRWAGGLTVDVDDIPMLRHRMTLGATPRAAGESSGTTPRFRAVSSAFRYPDDRPDAVDPDAYVARLRLAPVGDTPASLTTALADGTSAARRLCDRMESAALVPG